MAFVRRMPVIPTVLVLLAVGVMVRLGVWQLDRLHQKEALLASYAQAVSMSADAPWPRTAEAAEKSLYRHATISCASVSNATTKSGINAKGVAGIAHYVTCLQPDGSSADVVLGWSVDPASREWGGGTVSGIIAPGPRLVADPPLAGLEANARPDPAELPNNHLSYAVQWFLFAAVALVIYALALRKRLAGRDAEG
ncbi:MAG: SURF1 family protein [Novosphingobium sp.]|nr:SURF1 family protein [Novosphingobium sp.]